MKNEILDGIVYDKEEGALFFKGVRYMIIRPETLIAFQKAVEKKLPEKCAEFLYQGGYTGGYLSSKKFKEVMNFSDEEIANFMCKMGGEIGWGSFTIKRLDLESKVLVAEVQNSPFASAYGSSKKGVCHIIRGIFGGMSEILFGKKVKVSEEKCLAKGDDICQFKTY